MNPAITSWKPLGETVKHPVQQRLLAALRSALPKSEMCTQPEWQRGEVKDVQCPLPTASAAGPEAPVSQAVLLTQLSWRLVEFSEYTQRDMGQWNYQGIAWIDNKRIDFSGSYLRDLTTGAFWEFELKTMGV